MRGRRSFAGPLSNVVFAVGFFAAAAGVRPLIERQSSDAPSPPAGQGERTATDLSPVRPRMRGHFEGVVRIRDAVIRGDLEGTREPAESVAQFQPDELPQTARPLVDQMKRIAGELSHAPDLSRAAAGTARLAAACGACHRVAEAKPTLLGTIARADDGTLAGHMRVHQNAMDQLYHALVADSEESWERGTATLGGKPASMELLNGGQPSPGIEKLARQLHDLAEDARTARDWSARANVYGDMLTTCAECHSQQGITVPAPARP